VSQLSWLAYSETERKRTLEVIHLLGEQGTRDELGIGRIRDALAERLFPGTSTIQTRARYFLLIPWIYLRLEARSPIANAAGEARWHELRLLDALLENAKDDGSRAGIIGQRARQGLATLPSAIYWNGLRSWGILRYPGERRSYHRLLETADLRHPERDDDGTLRLGALDRNWDPDLPEPPRDIYEGATLELAPHETEYLRERIRHSHGNSALAELLDAPLPDELPPYVWELPAEALNLLSAENRHAVEQAELFSLGMHGAALLYNHMLASARQHPEWIEGYEERFASWCALAQVNLERLRAWREGIEELWAIVNSVNPRAPSERERRFVEAWLDLALADPTPSLLESEYARTLIADRERTLKGRNAPLANRSALEAWGGSSGSERLSFRWPTARSYLLDLQLAAPEPVQGGQIAAA